MFLASLLVLHLLHGSVCQDQLLHILDCYKKKEDIADVSHDLCEGPTSQCSQPLLDRLKQVKYLLNESLREEAMFYDTEYFRTNGVEHFERATELQGKASQTLEVLIQDIQLITKNESGIFSDNCSLALLDMETLMKQSTQCAGEYSGLQVRLEIVRFRSLTLLYYFLPFGAAIFTCGMLGNGLLLLIFSRHADTRKGPNALLVNLAISDTLFLLINIAANYCRMLWGFPLGSAACYVYNFLLTLITAASVYSMGMLSFSRYVAITAKPGSSLASIPIMLAAVWGLSALVAIPDTLTSELEELTVHTTDCNAANLVSNIACDFLFLSALPLTAITYFYVAASRRLRQSVRKMPGQAMGQDRIKTARERGAKILPGLIVTFGITFVPYFTFWGAVILFGIDTDKSLISHNMYFVVYFLFNLNSTLNPVALYLTSAMFRRYINMYMTLGKVKAATSAVTSAKSSNTVSSRT